MLWFLEDFEFWNLYKSTLEIEISNFWIRLIAFYIKAYNFCKLPSLKYSTFFYWRFFFFVEDFYFPYLKYFVLSLTFWNPIRIYRKFNHFDSRFFASFKILQVSKVLPGFQRFIRNWNYNLFDLNKFYLIHTRLI